MTQLAGNVSVATATDKEKSEALLKLQQGRAYLMVHHPFFSVLVLSLKLVESTLTETMATDGRNIYYNVQFVLELTVKQIASVLAHEGLHVGLSHHLRRGLKDSYWWNVACDYAINYSLLASGLYDLPNALFDEKYKGQSAEQIYNAVYEKDEPEPDQPDGPSDDEDDDEGDDGGGCGQRPSNRKKKGKGGGGKGEGQGEDSEGEDSEGEGETETEADDPQGEGEGGGKGKGNGKHGPKPKRKTVGEVWDAVVPEEGNRPLTQEEIAEEEREIAARVFEANAQEKIAGKGSSGVFRGILADKSADEVPWSQVLQMHMEAVTVVDSTFSTPNRRFIGQGIVLPGPEKRPNGALVFAIDTSASLGQEELDIIGGNIQQIKDAIQPLEVHVIYCDYSINKVDHFEFDEEIVLKAHGGGGTRFAPPFNWLEREGIRPDVLVYFTDGFGSVDGSMLDGGVPDYPVIWCSTGRLPHFNDVEEFGDLIEIGRIL